LQVVGLPARSKEYVTSKYPKKDPCGGGFGHRLALRRQLPGNALEAR
jgi:hypothetical protein